MWIGRLLSSDFGAALKLRIPPRKISVEDGCRPWWWKSSRRPKKRSRLRDDLRFTRPWFICVQPYMLSRRVFLSFSGDGAS